VNRKCLHCEEDERRGEGRWVVTICLADYPVGPYKPESGFEWLHSRAFCSKHAEGADENGFVKYRHRSLHRSQWRKTK
jgi:hypothetical protein